MNLETSEQKTTLQDYIVPQKIDAFVRTYTPASSEYASDVFTDARLREFFKAYVTSLGDPLALYLSELEHKGFQMQVTISGEPALFVTRIAL